MVNTSIIFVCLGLAVVLRTSAEEFVRDLAKENNAYFEVEYDLDSRSNVLQQASQIGRATAALLKLIHSQKDSVVEQVFPSGMLHLNTTHTFDWNYETFLRASLGSLLLKDPELFSTCYLQNSQLPPVACAFDAAVSALCSQAILNNFALNLTSKVSSDPLSEMIDPEVVRSIFRSNCGQHQLAISIGSKLRELNRDKAYSNYILAELLIRHGTQTSLTDALVHLNKAIKSDQSEAIFHESCLRIFIKNGLLQKAAEEAQLIRLQTESYLRQLNCTGCTQKPLRGALSLTAWRPSFIVGLYDLLYANGSHAVSDLTIALELVGLLQTANRASFSEQVIATLRYVKAIALHNVDHFQDAMELAVLTTHHNPTALDSVLLVSQTLVHANLFDRALNMLNLALPLMPVNVTEGDFLQTVADVPTLRRLSLQLRAVVNYRLGHIRKAQSDAKSCLSLLPSDALCSYVHALCLLVSGSFVDSLKAMAPVLYHDKLIDSAEYAGLIYLREWTRYLYRNLAVPLKQFHWLDSLPDVFKQSWIRSVPLHTVLGYVEQPSIDAEIPGFLISADDFQSRLSGNSPSPNQLDDPTMNTSDAACSYDSVVWRFEAPHCQQAYLRYLGDVLCKISTVFAFLNSRDTVASISVIPSPNLRHRFAFSLGALHTSEIIRNHWCRRRRVFFNTCWSYTRTAPLKGWRPVSFPKSEQIGPKFDQCSSRTSRRPCKSPRDTLSPDWFVQSSWISQLLMLADPHGIPPLWYAEYKNPSWASTIHSSRSPHRFWNSKTQSSRGGRDGLSQDSDSIYLDSTVHYRYNLVEQGRLEPKDVRYAKAALQHIRSTLKRRSPGSYQCPHCSSDGSKFSPFHDFLDAFAPTLSVERVLAALNATWLYAKQHDLLDDGNALAVRIGIPIQSRRSLKSASSGDGNKYLGSVLVLEKDNMGALNLLALLLSNQQDRQILGSEMDAAFQEFLSEGEKALATILAGSNPQAPSHRSMSPLASPYLVKAISSTFRWLYYWTLLKPVASVYSFHVGFSVVAGMLRALGLEPHAPLPGASRNMELEALFSDAPDEFAEMLYRVVNPAWLSEDTVSLTWFVSIEQLCQIPRDFIELLNLYSVYQCA